jgi:NAD(P)-dependent dehydrogenase (short-subunit alcohol dehydrogenase family)
VHTPMPVPALVSVVDLRGSLEQAADNDTWLKMIPLGRYGAAEEIGVMASVLASLLGGFVTGAHVVVDGWQGLMCSSTFNEAVAATLNASTR